jgi:tetratricopeptide (TPR) repeat protein
MRDDAQPREPLDEQAAAAIRAALDRVLASDAFRGAPQLSAFLSFIVIRAIAGRSAELKGYTIAVEALGRPPEFDPQADPIVRVEAGRLRKALSHYYAAEGARDALRIAMPIGGYVPVFERAGGDPEFPVAAEDLVSVPAAEGEPPTETVPRETPVVAAAPPIVSGVSRGWRTVAVLAFVVGAIAFIGWYREAMLDSRTAAVQGLATASSEAPAPAMGHLPIVVVTVADIPGEAELLGKVQYFARALVDAMARFDDLVTVRAVAVGARPADGADYAFELVTTPIGDQSETFGRLRSLHDGRIVWSASRIFARGSIDEQEIGEIARRLAVRLTEPFGIIHADFRQIATSPAMRCVFQALDYRRTMKAQDHLAARNCLEAAIDQDRTFSAAWAQLALLTLDEYTSGLNPLPGLPLDRALGAALNAVRYAPSSARAQQVMMDVLYARRQADEALAAGRQALSYNPYDPDIMADLGARLVQLDRPAEGLPLLQRAIEMSAGRPPWYDFFAFLGARLTGANRLAEGYTAVLSTDDSFYGLLGRAMQSAETDDRAGLATAIAGLVRLSPSFAIDARLNLGTRGFSPPVVDKIMTALGPLAAELIRQQ